MEQRKILMGIKKKAKKAKKNSLPENPLVGTTESGITVTGTSNHGAGVKGESQSGAIGVWGVANSGYGVGVSGNGGTGVNGYGTIGVGGIGTEYGGAFSVDNNVVGGLAPLRLVPSNSQGSPNTGNHLMGELYVDNKGALYYCVADGTPGTWKQLA
jgi:hypothetical protein